MELFVHSPDTAKPTLLIIATDMPALNYYHCIEYTVSSYSFPWLFRTQELKITVRNKLSVYVQVKQYKWLQMNNMKILYSEVPVV